MPQHAPEKKSDPLKSLFCPFLFLVYRKVTQWFYRNHYGKITASFEQTLKLYFVG